MADEIRLNYDAAEKRATLTFPNGRELKLGNVTEEQAKAFRDKHGAEFQKRDCCLTSVGGNFTRDA